MFPFSRRFAGVKSARITAKEQAHVYDSGHGAMQNVGLLMRITVRNAQLQSKTLNGDSQLLS